MNKNKIKKKFMKLETIYEHKVYVEVPKIKINEYNQINIMDKILELYVMLLKFIFK
jgi:hypothetical protein